jgi:hypothetical protein
VRFDADGYFAAVSCRCRRTETLGKTKYPRPYEAEVFARGLLTREIGAKIAEVMKSLDEPSEDRA